MNVCNCNFSNVAFLFELIVKIQGMSHNQAVLLDLREPHLAPSWQYSYKYGESFNSAQPPTQIAVTYPVTQSLVVLYTGFPPIFVRFYASKIMNLDFTVRQVNAAQTLEGWWSNSHHQEEYQPHLARGGDVFVDFALESVGEYAEHS